MVFDEDGDDGDYFEVECPTVRSPSSSMTRPWRRRVQCPNCETRFALDLSDDTVDADEDTEVIQCGLRT